MLRLVSAVPAADEPVTLAEAKQHLVVIHDADDALILAYIAAAREVVEQQTGYALVAATYDWTPGLPGWTELPIEPGNVESAEGSLPVRFTTTPGAIPAALRAAVLLKAADLYANREAGITGTIHVVNPAFDRLTFPYRRFRP